MKNYAVVFSEAHIHLSEDNSFLDMHNSSHHTITKPHSIFAKYTMMVKPVETLRIAMSNYSAVLMTTLTHSLLEILPKNAF